MIGSEPPNAQQLRKKGDLKLVAQHGRLTGQILRMFGFNLDLCPVLDLSFDDEADNSLKGRCYGTTPDEVIRNASVFNLAMRKEGVLSSGKHFPGYASAECDPHHELPVINKTLAEMEMELKAGRCSPTDRQTDNRDSAARDGRLLFRKTSSVSFFGISLVTTVSS